MLPHQVWTQGDRMWAPEGGAAPAPHPLERRGHVSTFSPVSAPPYCRLYLHRVSISRFWLTYSRFVHDFLNLVSLSWLDILGNKKSMWVWRIWFHIVLCRPQCSIPVDPASCYLRSHTIPHHPASFNQWVWSQQDQEQDRWRNRGCPGCLALVSHPRQTEVWRRIPGDVRRNPDQWGHHPYSRSLLWPHPWWIRDQLCQTWGSWHHHYQWWSNSSWYQHCQVWRKTN